MITGACLCGAVRYELDGPLGPLTHCHCSMCRKHHAAPFASFVEVPRDHLRWLAGEHLVTAYASSSGRVRCFCQLCGSVAPSPRGHSLLVPAGNLVGDLGDLRGRHVFVASKAPWHVIADALPQWDSAPPGWPPEVERPLAIAAADATAGSCLCGKVTFVVSGAPARWMQCHCSRCRRGRSAAHGSNTFYPLAQFAWQAGRDGVRSYVPADAERFTVAFCTCCGAGAPVERDQVPFVVVPAGLLDTDPGTRPEAHIHMASKSSWYAVQDELPQFAELPPA